MTLKNDFVNGDTLNASEYDAVVTAVISAEQTANRGQANGYASLDANGRIPTGQLPASAMEFQGIWNATSNSPTLADGAGSAGDVYRVGTAGTRDLGSGSVDFAVGDLLIYNGSIWQKADTTDSVTTVAGRAGDVTLTVADVGGNTTTALGVGSVELGHASDTTLTRSAAGKLAVEGVDVLLNGGALGTPTSGALTNCTDLPLAGLASAAYASAATASTLAQRDANGNLTADNYLSSVDSTATAAGTTTMTVNSAQIQVFTGSTTQTVLLPTTSVPAGARYVVINQSSGAVAVKSSGANLVSSVPAGAMTMFYALQSTPTTAAHWSSSGNVANALGQVADVSIVSFGSNTTRATGTGDFPFGVKLQRAVTFSSVTFRVATADASGNLVVELQKNGSTVAGSSTTIAAASQVAGGTSTGSWSFAAGDVLGVAVTAIGATPGKGLIADVRGLTS